LAFLEIQKPIGECAEDIPGVRAVSSALNCWITVQVNLGVQVLGFFSRLTGRERWIIADLDAPRYSRRAGANGVLKYPRSASVTRAKTKPSDIIVKGCVVGLIGPFVFRYLFRLSFIGKTPGRIGEAPW
jgi:hypothetical protein